MKLPTIKISNPEFDLAAWLKTNAPALHTEVDSAGAVLLRGLRITSESGFRELVADLSASPLEYKYRSTPRTDLGGGVYTATEYSPGLNIPLHNENSYQREWPLRLAFFCLQPASGGGGLTPLADTAAVTNRIDPDIRERFREKRVMYVRNYRHDIDIPWQTVFQTESRSQVEEYCRQHTILFEWTSAGNLRTQQICQALAIHPRTRTEVWFNQAHLFHPSSLDTRTREFMRRRFPEDEFPRNATYGDGSPISESDLEKIRKAFEAEAVAFEWQAGDALLLDNMLVSHGRTSYKGERRVLVAMYDGYSPQSDHSSRGMV